jgi:hypothetical protein
MAPPPGGQPQLNIGAALTYGWNGFKNNVGPILIVIGVIVVLNLLTLLLRPDGLVISLLWHLIVWIVSLIITLALTKGVLLILDGEPPALDKMINGDYLVPYAIASIISAVIVSIGFILCIIPGFIAIYLLQFFGYAIVDDKTMNPVESLKISYGITSKNVGSLILLILAVFGLNLIGAILCGIGLLVTVPVTYIAIGYAWRTLTGGRIAPQA